MARNTEYQQREENPHQGPSHSFGKPGEASTQSTKEGTATTSGRNDRETSIRTNREPGNAVGFGRPSGISRGYGPAYGFSPSPFSMMRRMVDEMDRMFGGFGAPALGLTPAFGTSLDSDMWADTPALDRTLWSPQIETFRRGDKLIVRADLPGLRKEDVKVEVDNGILAISGERREENEENRDNLFRSERTYGQFYRAIPLPDGVSGDKCDATFRDGVLEVSLPAPKDQERKSRQIQIK